MTAGLPNQKKYKNILRLIVSVILGLSTFFVFKVYSAGINTEEYVFISRDTIQISSLCVISGNIHSNNTVEISDLTEIEGQISTQELNLDSILNIDFSEYQTINRTLELEYTKLNGCFYVNGDVVIKNKFSGRISIVATGNIDINGDVDIKAIKDKPVFYTETGEISIDGEGRIKGLIYANKITASGTIEFKSIKTPRNKKKETQLFFQSMGIILDDPEETKSKPIKKKLKKLDKSNNKDIPLYYTLSSDAEAEVTVLSQNRVIINHYVIQADEESKNKKSKVLLWDGKDSSGKEVPDGNYFILLVVRYSDEQKETKTYLIEKGK